MTEIPPEYLNQIVTGDARELAKRIPDESIDLILCDPVYWRVEDYEWLAQVAERILISGGNVIAQAGNEYLHEAEALMRKSKLVPRPLLAEIYSSATAQMWKHRTLTGWKAYIWMSQGDRLGGWIFDRFAGGGSNKNHHEWGDSPRIFIELIGRLTSPDAVILDPFTGGGTVPAVCKMLGRNYIAFEIDPATAEMARRRVESTQPPLFVVQHEQENLL